MNGMGGSLRLKKLVSMLGLAVAASPHPTRSPRRLPFLHHKWPFPQPHNNAFLTSIDYNYITSGYQAQVLASAELDEPYLVHRPRENCHFQTLVLTHQNCNPPRFSHSPKIQFTTG